MAIENKTVVHAKEAGDVMALAVGVVKHFKEGKGLAEAAELLDDLMLAVQGVDQVDDEWKLNKAAVFNAVLLGASELVEVLLHKEEEVVE